MNIEGKYNYVAGVYHKNPEKYGVLVENNGFLKKVVEKPKEFVGNLINTGLYKFTPEIFSKLPKIKKSPRGEYEITDAINLLAKEKKVKIQKIKDFWLDFGNPADIIKISYFLKSFKKFKKLFLKYKKFEITSARARDAVEKTVRFLDRGQVVVCPTDTVYGLLADATNDKAVEKVFEIKKRDKGKPIPIFIKDIEMAKKITLIDKAQEEFLKEVWPGRITVVLKRKKKCGLSRVLFGRLETIGLRIPDYKLINDLLLKIKKPLTGTSANISGRPPITKFKGILEEFEEKEHGPDLILDAGNLSESPPSTVIDLTRRTPKILRG
jgi:L-threonylcarbamoyladenylate synthase